MLYLDGQQCRDKETAYRYLINRLDLPAYTGHNLDALWDSLEDLKPQKITLSHARYLPQNMGGYGLKLLDLLGDLDQAGRHDIYLKW